MTKVFAEVGIHERKILNWDFPKQTMFGFGDPPGDCWRCCIAAILQMPADQVPHFMQIAKIAKRGSADADTNRWLMQRGYCLAQVGPDWKSFTVVRWGGDPEPMLPIIECGPTVRSKKPEEQHAVVKLNGKLVYDPHPDNAGLLAVVSRYVLVKTFA